MFLFQSLPLFRSYFSAYTVKIFPPRSIRGAVHFFADRLTDWLFIDKKHGDILAVRFKCFAVEFFAERHFRCKFAAFVRRVFIAFVAEKVCNKIMQFLTSCCSKHYRTKRNAILYEQTI